MRPKLECRIVLTYEHLVTEVGMYDPKSGRYEPLGKHRNSELDKVVRDLKTAIERAGHHLTFCEREG